MKTFRLVSLVGITSIALAHAGWAAGHSGGGGGFGGGGFSGGGGHFGGGARSGGFGGAPHFAGGGFNAPHAGFGGAVNRGGGVGFSMPRRSTEVPHFATGPTNVRPVIPSRSPTLPSSVGRSGGNLTNVSRGNRTSINQGRAATALKRSSDRGGQTSRATTPRPSNEAVFNRDHHIFARDNGAQHRDWDRRHAHFFHGHWWCWDGAFWIGLDDGFYPWDFYPYYVYDYYPYDYYTDVESDDQGYAAQQPDQNVSAVQTDLAQLGYYNGPIDGLFGADTRTAVTRYQIDYHLQVTGSLTNETLQSLGLPALAGN
jgi:hypothetical protein